MKTLTIIAIVALLAACGNRDWNTDRDKSEQELWKMPGYVGLTHN